VNFYKHHIGDYQKKTSHLTVLEHGAYLLMLHAYYSSEKPLPFGRDLYRICRAFGKKERSAIDKIAAQFWTKTETGYVNGRAFEEIIKADDLRQIAQHNGKSGGRPKEPSGLPENNPSGLISEPSGKAIQTPDSRLQTPDSSKSKTQKKTVGRATPPATRKCPPEFRPDLAFALAELPDLDSEREAAIFKDCEFKTPHSDWAATWRNWIRNAKNRGTYSKINPNKGWV